jgi:hypothetical protein
MLDIARQNVTQLLWSQYCKNTDHARLIEHRLQQQGISVLPLDHFAVIDLPGPHTGRHVLAQIFSELGYLKQGEGYLPDKQNDFSWMTEENSFSTPVSQVLPQVVVADFRLDELPVEIKTIIAHYAQFAPLAPIDKIRTLAAKTRANDQAACLQLCQLITDYFAGRDWPLPTKSEFLRVHEFNELLAWVLVFGRMPNHFTLSIHLLPEFKQLSEFHQLIHDDMNIPLNLEGGIIKGSKHSGIEQSSTAGIPQAVALSDGTIELPTGFIEFVWRYPNTTCSTTPVLWSDYFTGFVATHANHVIESLYTT